MESDIQADCEGYGNDRRIRSVNMANKKFSSIGLDEDQVDSGLGSIGYYSLDSLDSLTQIRDERVHHSQIQQQGHDRSTQSQLRPRSIQSKRVDSGIENVVDSFRGLDIQTTKSLDSVQSERCDSGISDLLDKYDSSNIQNEPWFPVSSSFTSEQVLNIFRGDEDGDNHLHLSIINGRPEVTMEVISIAPNSEWLNETNNLLQSPLHLAVIVRQVAVVRRLMCAGAAVDLMDQMGNTPLHNACRLGFEDVVRTLLTPVRYEETYQNNYQVPLQCIPQDLEAKNYEGLTCLHLAAIGGHINVMRLLLSAGANINTSEGKGGRTVLHLAADWGNHEMLTFLLDSQGIDINAMSYAGMTPILLAYGRSNVQAVKELYRRGAATPLNSVEESDCDTSDEEMIDDSMHNHLCSLSRGIR